MSFIRGSKLSRLLGVAFGVAGTCVVALPSVASANDVEAKFLEMDTNSDGKVSRDEHAQWASRMFERQDLNRDRKVTAAEMIAPHQRMAKFDTDGDGVLTRDEYDAAGRAMFEEMDTDHDGYLTRAELKAGHDKDVYNPSK